LKVVPTDDVNTLQARVFDNSADAVSNASLQGVASPSPGYVYNGTTWDKVRSAGNAAAGILRVLGTDSTGAAFGAGNDGAGGPSGSFNVGGTVTFPFVYNPASGWDKLRTPSIF